jgi:diguanylate cyclase (GGDEF)-like protein
MRATRDGSWSTHELAEFVAAVSGFPDSRAAMEGALWRATDAFGASFGVVLGHDWIGAAVGILHAEEIADHLCALPEVPVAPVELPGVDTCWAYAIALDDGGRLVLGREYILDEEELSLARAMGRVLALGLRTIQSFGALQERQALLERMSEILRSITRRENLQTTLDAIVAGAAALVEEPIAALRLRDPEDQNVAVMVSSVGVPEEVGDQARRSRLGEGAGGQAIAEERLVVIEDYFDAEDIVPAFSAYRIQTAMSAPVRDQGRVVGSLTVATRTAGRRFSASEQEVLLAFAEHASLAVTDARMVDDARHRAMHDGLTGLPNRALFLDRIAHALASARRRGSAVAVLFLDLDNFKVVNDSLGHAAGDELLIAVGARLHETLRRSDTVARFGGDEFAILVEDVASEHDAVRVAEQVAALFVHPFPLEGREHFVSASIGIAISDGAAGLPETLIRNADAAMYRSKAQGRGGYELYDEIMRARALERLRIEGELRVAQSRSQLRLAYQPIVSLKTGEVTGAEALVRWAHPERGELAPDQFISVAEDSGLIIRLGEWVLGVACEEAARWARRRPDGPPLSVAVNLSARQVAEPRLAGVVEEALVRSGLDPANLVLEITESVLLEDAEAPAQTLRAVKDLGVRLVLDDFGTGYSSLGYLKRLPLDGLKIDRQFVDGLGTDSDDTAIVSAVTGMARGLGLEVIAEGVETVAQRDALRDLGCQRAQGFLFGRPVPAESFRAMTAGAGRVPRPCPAPHPPSTR